MTGRGEGRGAGREEGGQLGQQRQGVGWEQTHGDAEQESPGKNSSMEKPFRSTNFRPFNGLLNAFAPVLFSVQRVQLGVRGQAVNSADKLRAKKYN